MPSYYDFVLALIPVSLFGVSGLLTGVGLDLTLAVPAGAAVAAGFIGHAMFVRAPTQARDQPTVSTEAGFTPSAD